MTPGPAPTPRGRCRRCAQAADVRAPSGRPPRAGQRHVLSLSSGSPDASGAVGCRLQRGHSVVRQPWASWESARETARSSPTRGRLGSRGLRRAVPWARSMRLPTVRVTSTVVRASSSSKRSCTLHPLAPAVSVDAPGLSISAFLAAAGPRSASDVIDNGTSPTPDQGTRAVPICDLGPKVSDEPPPPRWCHR